METIYSRQLIAEIAENINPLLRDFFEYKKDVFEFPVPSITQAVTDAMNYYYKGDTAREDLSARMLVIKQSRKKKRIRWYRSYQEDIKLYSIDSKKHPAAMAVQAARAMTPDSYRNIYGEKTIQMIVDEEAARTEQWFLDPDSPLVAYPYIGKFTCGSIYKSFRADLIIDIWRYLQDTLDGNIESFMNRFPENLISLPLFTARQFHAKMEEEGELLKDVVYDEEGAELLTLTVNANEGQGNPVKIMDATDRMLFAVLLSRIKNSFYYDKKVSMPLSELARAITGRKKCNSEQKERIRQRLLKFTDYSYSFTDDKKMYSFNFFDNVSIDAGGEETVVCTFGEMLHDSVVRQKLIGVTANEMRSLENKLAQVIFFAMQKERISAAQKGDLEGIVSYSVFLQIARFPTANKRKNMKEIRTALDEFVAQGIAIKSYVVEGDIFIIQFIPLSAAEKDDLNLENNRWVIADQQG